MREPPVLLAIEDEEPIVGLLAALATDRAMKFVAAHTGAEAVAQLGNVRPAIITLDLVLPDLDGFAILKQIRSKPELDDIPVLVVTVLAESQFVRRAYEMGAFDFITKPFSVNLLGAKFDAILRMWRKNEVLREQLQTLGQLAHSFAHEVRNPLTAINSAAQVIQRADCVPLMRQRIARAIENESHRAAGLVEQYVEQHTPTVLFQEVDLGALLEEIREINLLAESARDRVTITCDASLPHISADPARIKQVILNLLSNAIAATAKGGVVELAAHVEENGVALTVSDTGCGIPPADMPRIFDADFSTNAAGRGLGLAIVRSIIEQHYGKLRVESTPGGGTIFTAWLRTR